MNSETGHHRQITAILPTGNGRAVLEILANDCALPTATLNRARGVGIVPLIGKRGLGNQVEWEIVTVIVPEERCNEVFELMFIEGDIDRPHGGFLYQGDIQVTTHFELPEVECPESTADDG